MAQDIIVKSGEAVARITLNRPERRNALSLDLMGEVIDTLRSLAGDGVTRVIVLDGAGPAFSAGHDLNEVVANRNVAFYQRLIGTCVEMMELLHDVPQPVIAKVHGVATAAGCQLVAACDLAIASEEARFATPGVNIGLFCSTPMVPVSRAVGRKRAMEMLLTGEMIPATTAAEWGLVNRAVPADRLEDEVVGLAEKIAAASPLTIGLGKRAFHRQIDLDERQAYDVGSGVMVSNAMADDAHEGISAFLEKRTPHWTGH
jgi:enoyl-CoA hydratase/carnithine racemase